MTKASILYSFPYLYKYPTSSLSFIIFVLLLSSNREHGNQQPWPSFGGHTPIFSTLPHHLHLHQLLHLYLLHLLHHPNNYNTISITFFILISTKKTLRKPISTTTFSSISTTTYTTLATSDHAIFFSSSCSFRRAIASLSEASFPKLQLLILNYTCTTIKTTTPSPSQGPATSLGLGPSSFSSVISPVIIPVIVHDYSGDHSGSGDYSGNRSRLFR